MAQEKENPWENQRHQNIRYIVQFMVFCQCSFLRFDKHATVPEDANVRGGWAQGVPELSRARAADEVLPPRGESSWLGGKRILVTTMVRGHGT